MSAYDDRQTAIARPSIIRIDKKRGGWEQIPAALLRDRRLELDTLGLFTWLLSMPDGWEIRATSLPHLLKSKREGHYGRERVRRMLRQLEATGYLTRQCHHGSDGRWIWHNVLSDASATVDGLPVAGSTVDGSARRRPTRRYSTDCIYSRFSI